MNKLIVFISGLFLPLSVLALDVSENSEIHGFAMQSYVYSPDNPYAGTASKDGSFDFREIGLNGFVELSPSLRVAGQVLSRKVGEVDDGALRVDFLLLDYQFYSSPESMFGVRLGRVKNNIGFYNSSRDVPSARPGTKVPESVYFDSFRDAFLSVDGINLYGALELESGFLSWEIFRGNKKLENPSVEYYMFGGAPAQGGMNDIELSGLSLSFSPNKISGLRLAASALQAYAKFDGAQSADQAQATLEQSDAVQNAAVQAVTPVSLGGLGLSYGSASFFNYLSQASQAEIANNPSKYVTGLTFKTLYTLWSIQYGFDDWLLTAEYMRLFNSPTISMVGTSAQQTFDTEGFYLQAEWFAMDDLSLYGRYEEMYLNADDRNSEQFSFDYNPSHGFSKGLTFGAKWQLSSNWMLLGEMSINDGTAWLPSYPGIEQEAIRKHWNTYSVAVSFQF